MEGPGEGLSEPEAAAFNIPRVPEYLWRIRPAGAPVQEKGGHQLDPIAASALVAVLGVHRGKPFAPCQRRKERFTEVDPTQPCPAPPRLRQLTMCFGNFRE